MSPIQFLRPLLCFDTAGDQLLVTLVKDGVSDITERRVMTHGQAEELLPAIKKILQEANTASVALRGIFITLGPGSFTGLRVAAAAAIGLGVGLGFLDDGMTDHGLTNDKKIYGMGSLPAMLFSYLAKKKYHGDRTFLVMAESRRDEIFYQRFLLRAAENKIVRAMPEPLMARREELLDHYQQDEVVVTAVDFERLVPTLQQYNGHEFITNHLTPVYARQADARKRDDPA